jgi:hypothetical protein
MSGGVGRKNVSLGPAGDEFNEYQLYNSAALVWLRKMDLSAVR